VTIGAAPPIRASVRIVEPVPESNSRSGCTVEAVNENSGIRREQEMVNACAAVMFELLAKISPEGEVPTIRPSSLAVEAALAPRLATLLIADSPQPADQTDLM
jgi:hypothetical protein